MICPSMAVTNSPIGASSTRLWTTSRGITVPFIGRFLRLLRELPPGVVPTRVGEIACWHDVNRSRARPLAVQARLERRRELRVQAQEGPVQGHRAGDVVDEGRAGLDAGLPPQVPRPLRAAPHADLGWGHVPDLHRR